MQPISRMTIAWIEKSSSTICFSRISGDFGIDDVTCGIKSTTTQDDVLGTS